MRRGAKVDLLTANHKVASSNLTASMHRDEGLVSQDHKYHVEYVVPSNMSGTHRQFPPAVNPGGIGHLLPPPSYNIFLDFLKIFRYYFDKKKGFSYFLNKNGFIYYHF